MLSFSSVPSLLATNSSEKIDFVKLLANVGAAGVLIRPRLHGLAARIASCPLLAIRTGHALDGHA